MTISNQPEACHLPHDYLIITSICAAETSANAPTHHQFLHRDVNMAQASSPESPNKLELEDDFMHYYVVDGVRLPPFCRGKIQDILEFPCRSDDVWILSYPRAGKLR